ncbi:DUF4440 domain-containing protein [Actinomadura darangshiensis]|uniref:DUF4440 domain-containing protein n=1 Tax=Actinomadura darangshiensis TaxID=705336 RepID=A0A4R5AA61_9ACTN|nr:DUF4440 domain-containing protein [Actinomadura darangshiensis]TDD69183.1 DUF4440 domain-containing protein [Actinomadura darangshiensis]
MRPLADRPEDVPPVFADRFNSGDPDAVAEMYEQGGVFVPAPGTPLTGAGARAANARFMSLGLPIKVSPRHVYTAGDLALLIVDWVIEGIADGRPVRIEGTATDVARRAADGHWRYIIDNPFGTAHDGPARP